MLCGVCYLHHHRIIHRDIKPENYLVQRKGELMLLKLADFGLACNFKKGRPLKEMLGTPCYVLLGRYDERCDVWSIGVVSFVLCTGHHPFAFSNADTAKVVLQRIKANEMDARDWQVSCECPLNKRDVPQNENTDAQWNEVHDEARDLVFKMMQRDPEERPRAKRILAGSTWLQQFDIPDRRGLCMKTVLMVKPTLETEYDGAFPRDLTGGQMGCRCFELLGIDVMLDAKMKPYLIEVNHLPSFTCDSPLDEDIKQRLVQQTLDLTCGSLSSKDKKMYEQLVRERKEVGQATSEAPRTNWEAFEKDQ
eukprot:s490_g17.t1